MRSEQEVNRAMERHADTVRRLCLIHLKNHADTEDIFQNVFLKYALSSIRFESEEHERAWFIRVTLNACRDLLRRFFRRRTVSLEKLVEQFARLPGVGVRLRCVATDEEYFYPSSKMSVNSVNRLCFPTDIDFTPGEWEAIIGSQYTPTYHLYKKERYGYLTFTVV